MAFRPISWDSGKVVTLPQVASAVITKHDAIEDDGNGFYQRATATSTRIRYVALQAQTAAAGTNPELLALPTTGVRFVANTDADPARTDVGTLTDLATFSTINPDASVQDAFYIEDIYGAVADRTVVGYFTEGETV